MKELINKLGTSDLMSLEKVLKAYRENAHLDVIGDIGFNENSGYVYIYLNIGISICSCFGHDVEYLVTDFETGEETFFNDYDEAITNL
jgi:hypothetical protein